VRGHLRARVDRCVEVASLVEPGALGGRRRRAIAQSIVGVCGAAVTLALVDTTDVALDEPVELMRLARRPVLKVAALRAGAQSHEHV